MVDRLLTAATDPAEAQGSGENRAAPLPRLYGPGHKASAVANSLDVV
jgi:hypothetical protein